MCSPVTGQPTGSIESMTGVFVPVGSGVGNTGSSHCDLRLVTKILFER
jgi:hypothetical protein